MSALFVMNCLSVVHLFIELDVVFLYIYLVLLFVLIFFTAMCIIGLILENSILILSLVGYYIIHVIILGVLDVIKIVTTMRIATTGLEPNGDISYKEQLTYDVSNIVLNTLAYSMYVYFSLVFYSLYVDCKERTREWLTSMENDGDDSEDSDDDV